MIIPLYSLILRYTVRIEILCCTCCYNLCMMYMLRYRLHIHLTQLNVLTWKNRDYTCTTHMPPYMPWTKSSNICRSYKWSLLCKNRFPIGVLSTVLYNRKPFPTLGWLEQTWTCEQMRALSNYQANGKWYIWFNGYSQWHLRLTDQFTDTFTLVYFMGLWIFKGYIETHPMSIYLWISLKLSKKVLSWFRSIASPRLPSSW